ncbi:SH3 domain-containing protein [Neorhizobium sp. BT27B]|uniref:SH3 domain-containing protein n=1 Tax=Neorhizobium sp. BT27B TaxID=3142625 RepID=UPI003D2B100C
MKKFILAAAATSALMVAPTLAEAAARGYATANVNMRSGPSTGYPAVTVVPVGAPITIHGCMSNVNWCDVQFAGGRGWVSGSYISTTYRQNRIYVEPEYYRPLGIPTVTFEVDNYWGRYYRDRDFYRDRDRWDRRPPPPPPRWTRDDRRPPPPAWDRDDRRGPPPGPPPGWDRGDDRRGPPPGDWGRDRDRDRGGNWDRGNDDRRGPPPGWDRGNDDRRGPPQGDDRRGPPQQGDDRRGPPPGGDRGDDRRGPPRGDAGNGIPEGFLPQRGDDRQQPQDRGRAPVFIPGMPQNN